MLENSEKTISVCPAVGDRRSRSRFPICREISYKLIRSQLEGGPSIGCGLTIDIGSGGVAFCHENSVPTGAFVELSISWPVLLDDICPIRLVVFGRVIRRTPTIAVSTVDKYEFRTQSRSRGLTVWTRNDGMLERFAAAHMV